ncbi:MAG: DNA polymerase III subunit gamma/tau, partial [Candidatus Adiutrix sp.]
MSYLVLARKYRPQTFADLIGQEQVSRTLKNALLTGRVAHAYLFSGPRGVGKTTAARLLAMALSCADNDIGRRPCGECASCLEIQSGQAVDVIEVDGASNRGINEIRDLRETVKYLPAKSPYKVYIIDEVHALTKDAFNALLKTLEEPPAHVVFIFATTETHKVLPTILSRCQRYDFRRIGVDDIVGRLTQVALLENIEAEPHALELIARKAEGGLRDSLSLMDQATAFGGGQLTAEDVQRALGLIDQALVRKLSLATLSGGAKEALAALNEAYLKGYDFKDLGLKILEYVRGLTLIRVDLQNIDLLNLTETEVQDFMAEAKKYSLETLHRHFDSWLKFQNELGRNPNPRWLLEAQIVALANTAPLMPLAGLIERLTKLLGQNPPPRLANIGGGEVNLSTAPNNPVPPTVGEKNTAPISPTPLEAAALLSTPASLLPPRDWDEFKARFASELDDNSQARLAGVKPTSFTPELVSLLFPPTIELGQIMSQRLHGRL